MNSVIHTGLLVTCKAGSAVLCIYIHDGGGGVW